VSGGLPRVALVVLVVGLALHNVAMALLTGWGVTGSSLSVVAAWKEVLLLVAALAALAAAGGLPRLGSVDRAALAYTGLVVAYAVVPQAWLGGDATAKGELYALRHHLLPVGAYALGRLLVLEPRWWRRVGRAIVATGALVAVWGLVDVYAVPLSWWRDSGVPEWFGGELGLVYECLSGLPENWILNTGDEDNPLRRLVGPFLSPLASAYLLVIALLLLAAIRPRRWTVVSGVLLSAGLLWTHTRAAYLTLAGGLVILALVKRRRGPALLAGATLVVSVGFVALFPTIGPGTSYTTEELRCLRENAAQEGGESGALSGGDASTRSHLRNLRDGVETVLRHPWGYGLGNAGVVASRTGVEPKAGESTYTELGVDTGALGLAAFVAWLVLLLRGLWARSPWLTASIAAVAAIGLQTDVIGVHWIAVVVFALAGAAVARDQAEAPPEDAV
jgi:hypothetical protein